MEELNNNTLNQFDNTNFIDVFDDNESTLVDNSNILGADPGIELCSVVPLGYTGVLGAVSTDTPVCYKDSCSSNCTSNCTSNCPRNCPSDWDTCPRNQVIACPIDCRLDCTFDCTFDCTDTVPTYYYAIGIYLCLSGYTNSKSNTHLISSNSVSCQITGGTLSQSIATTLFPIGTGQTYNFTKSSNGNFYYVKTGTTTKPSQISTTTTNGTTALTANISLQTVGYSTVDKSARCFFYAGTGNNWILTNTIVAACPRNSVITQMNHMLIRSTGTTVPSPCRWKITSHTGAVSYAHTFNCGPGADVISGITIYSSATSATFSVQGMGVEGDTSGAWTAGLSPNTKIVFYNGNIYPINTNFAPSPSASVIATTDLLNNIYPNYKKYTSIFPTANSLALSTGRGIATSEFSFAVSPSNDDQLIPLNYFLRPATSAIFTNLISGSTKFTHYVVI